jgi:hypothetical protein
MAGTKVILRPAAAAMKATRSVTALATATVIGTHDPAIGSVGHQSL